ncbi:MAG: hypothetical protein BWX80_02148 [Candidatus Hydrogenedentes bacterium ADurb.Bin101]|nr:MAG: hypothetical protein BWX80_02148 [Candidatus Hydrogenedentes bacterium ADurb.Bin101]
MFRAIHFLVDIGHAVGQGRPAVGDVDFQGTALFQGEAVDAFIAQADDAPVRARRDMKVVLDARAAARHLQRDARVEVFVPDRVEGTHSFAVVCRIADEVVEFSVRLTPARGHDHRRTVEDQGELVHFRRGRRGGFLAWLGGHGRNGRYGRGRNSFKQLEAGTVVCEAHIRAAAVQGELDGSIRPLTRVLDEDRVALYELLDLRARLRRGIHCGPSVPVGALHRQ